MFFFSRIIWYLIPASSFDDWIYRESDSKSEPKECHIIFVPRKSHICEKKLKELGVYGTFKENLKEFFLDLIPLDYDLLSMENPEIYRVSVRFCCLSNESYRTLHQISLNRLRTCFYTTTPHISFILPNRSWLCKLYMASFQIFMAKESTPKW